jgi:aminoglycoside phosphotransferase (APT) family kinase protein
MAGRTGTGHSSSDAVIGEDLRHDDQVRAAITRESGDIRRVQSVGRSGSTHIVEADRMTVVVKRMDDLREPARFADYFTLLSREPSPFSPRLITTVELRACWFAVFEFVAGTVPNPAGSAWRTYWQAAYQLLERLRDLTAIVPEWPLETIWLERLSRWNFEYVPARFLLDSLGRRTPGGPRTLAHGDFGAQNLLHTRAGLVLVDWEEIGSAPIGFDAGWILALNRVGAGPLGDQLQVFQHLVARGFPAANLSWFEVLGLLRLLYRAMTLPLDAAVRTILVESIRAEISSYGDKMG